MPVNDPYRNGIETPEWEQTFHPDGAMSFGADAHGHPGVLTIHGLRDLAHHLTEEAAEEIRAWMEEGEREESIPDWLRAVLPVPVPPLPVLMDINPPRTWTGQAQFIPQQQVTPVSFRGGRVRLVIANVGTTNPVWISANTDAQSFDPSGNSPNSWVQIPAGNLPGNPREIRAGGKVYAWCNAAGGGQIDVQEEYGYRYREGGFLSP